MEKPDIKITIKPGTSADKAFREFMAEKHDRRLDQQQKAADFARELKKPTV